jgi:uncharacterized membrane protein
MRVYRFAKTAAVVGSDEYVRSDDLDELIDRIERLEAHGDQTRPGPAVEKILDDLRGTPPTAIVIFTDGVTTTTDADRLTSAAESSRSQFVPVFAVGIGSDEPARDVVLYDVLADEVAFVNEPFTFSAKMKGYGYEGDEATIVLRQQGSDEVLVEKSILIGADGQSLKVELAFTPERTGEFDYVIEAVSLDNETNAANNSETRPVSVRQGRLRVLLIESAPRWEFRELKKLLERESTVELHTVLQDADLEYAEQDRTARPLGGRVPVKRDDLFSYDVIILGDVDLSYLSPRTLESFRDFVRDAGGGMIFIAGTRYNPSAYQETPLESLLPVELPTSSAITQSAGVTEPFQLRLTADGREGTPIFRTEQIGESKESEWDALPDIRWSHEVWSTKPGARVLAVHATRATNEGNLPILIMQQFGSGRVLFHATDELWRWRHHSEGDRAYTGYWLRAIRHLGRNRLVGQARAAELNSDRVVYQTGESVTLRARFYAVDQSATGIETVRVVVERRDAEPISAQLRPVPDGDWVFEASIDDLVQGAYHAWIAAPGFEAAPPSTNFRVESPQRELLQRNLDRAELTTVAKMTHGHYFSVLDAHRVPARIPDGRPVRLESGNHILIWNRWELLIAFTMLIGLEWLLRKRFRLI